MLEQVNHYLKSLQDKICDALEQADGEGVFQEEAWQRAGGGGGRSRVLRDGAVLEQGGVGYSHVFGEQMPASAGSSPSSRNLLRRRFQFVQAVPWSARDS